MSGIAISFLPRHLKKTYHTEVRAKSLKQQRKVSKCLLIIFKRSIEREPRERNLTDFRDFSSASEF